MQRTKQLTSAFLVVLATSTVAYAGEQPQDQGGRNSEPAPRTGSGAPATDSTNHAGPSGQAAAPKTAADMNASPSKANQAPRAGEGASQQGWAANLDRGQIAQLQRELASRGLYQGPVDGIAGRQTLAALNAFQRQLGLPTQNGFDEQTRQALGLQLDRQPVSGAQTSASPELQRSVGRDSAVTGTKTFRSQVPLDALTQDQRKTVQTRMQELGFYQGEVDGVLGQGTRAAVQRFFQTQADLAARGMISDVTASVFGLSPRELDPAVGAAAQAGTGPAQPSGTSASPSNTSPSPRAGVQGGMNPPSGSSGSRPSGTSPPQGGATGSPQGGTTGPQQGTR
jgi:peptidoglycan hydrolase-like protein with peptidoglycan-binding domain